jgi:hypothetical protein
MTNNNRYNDIARRSKLGVKTMDWKKVFKKKSLLDKIVDRLRKMFPKRENPVIQPMLSAKSYDGFGGYEYNKRLEKHRSES